MALGKDSDSHRIQVIDRMGKRLKNRKAVFRTVAFLAQSRESKPMRGTVGKIKPTFGRKIFILRIGKAFFGPIDHAVKLRARWRLAFDLSNLSEVFELLFAHALSQLPIQK